MMAWFYRTNSTFAEYCNNTLPAMHAWTTWTQKLCC